MQGPPRQSHRLATTATRWPLGKHLLSPSMCQASSGQAGGFPGAPGLGESEAGTLKNRQ